MSEEFAKLVLCFNEDNLSSTIYVAGKPLFETVGESVDSSEICKRLNEAYLRMMAGKNEL